MHVTDLFAALSEIFRVVQRIRAGLTQVPVHGVPASTLGELDALQSAFAESDRLWKTVAPLAAVAYPESKVCGSQSFALLIILF